MGKVTGDGGRPTKPLGRVNGVVHTYSEVNTGTNWEGRRVVELRLSVTNFTTSTVMDRATAGRLINQLRRALDEPAVTTETHA